jgi:hypothetical protein
MYEILNISHVLQINTDDNVTTHNVLGAILITLNVNKNILFLEDKSQCNNKTCGNVVIKIIIFVTIR